MIVMLCGLSRSGKSSLIDACDLDGLGFRNVKASDLLRSEGRPIERLRATDVETNQRIIVTRLLEFKTTDRVLLDGHLLIETLDGPRLVLDSELASLAIVGVFAVDTASEKIVRRRLDRGEKADIEEISDLMTIEVCHARRLARCRQVPFKLFKADDVLGLVEALRLIVMTAEASAH